MLKYIVKIRSQLLVYLTHKMALPILKKMRKTEIFPYTLVELKKLPLSTLGYDLYQFLETKKLDLLPSYAKHDIKHILLGYDTTDEGEVCLQCFMLGNKHISFPVAATVFYGFFTMPEYWRKFVAAYKRGAKCNPIQHWNWVTLLEQNTLKLKQIIND